MDRILASHYQATAARDRAESVMLAVQDTTTLNYTAQPLAEAGFGPIGSRADGAQGLIVHGTLVLNPAGTPLRLLDVRAWARERDDHGLRRLGGDDLALDDITEMYRVIRDMMRSGCAPPESSGVLCNSQGAGGAENG
jgi:hypothetical protein